MALINCPECGKEVSDRAQVCIHCGYPLSELKNTQEVSANESVVIDEEAYKNDKVISREIDASKYYKVSLVKLGLDDEKNKAAIKKLGLDYDRVVSELPFVLAEDVDGKGANYILNRFDDTGCTIEAEEIPVDDDEDLDLQKLYDLIIVEHASGISSAINVFLSLKDMSFDDAARLAGRDNYMILNQKSISEILPIAKKLLDAKAELVLRDANGKEYKIPTGWKRVNKSSITLPGQQPATYSASTVHARSTTSYHGYKCPSCGEMAGKEMSKLRKTFSLGVWGAASNKFTKTYKCEKCGYMW